ncbi:MAG: pseudoazurin [Rhodospirillaceae bacterium]|nr:pseudoazurin [Rhodospirillaceae bacterium]|tara:strand:- start:10937 stop:11371 length:435 start_codon:yes stop_codon:yes gene_type:complete
MRTLFLFCISFFYINASYGADFTIDMLNKKGKERMIFSEKIIRINSGDTVFWKAKSKGHNVEFITKNGVPGGVNKFKSKLSKDTQYKFTKPGIYAYWCTPHKSMGMIGFVIVDNNLDNLENIKKVKFFGKSKKLAKKLIQELNS